MNKFIEIGMCAHWLAAGPDGATSMTPIVVAQVQAWANIIIPWFLFFIEHNLFSHQYYNLFPRSHTPILQFTHPIATPNSPLFSQPRLYTIGSDTGSDVGDDTGSDTGSTSSE